jgi:hypothetical protein
VIGEELASRPKVVNPIILPTRHEMHVEVEYGLRGRGAGRVDHVEAFGLQGRLEPLGDVQRRLKDVLGRLVADRPDIRKVLLRDHERVAECRRTPREERQDVLVLVHDAGRLLASHDLAERTIRLHRTPPHGSTSHAKTTRCAARPVGLTGMNVSNSYS